MNHNLGTMVLFENPKVIKLMHLLMHTECNLMVLIILCSQLFHMYPAKFVGIAKIQRFKFLHI